MKKIITKQNVADFCEVLRKANRYGEEIFRFQYNSKGDMTVISRDGDGDFFSFNCGFQWEDQKRQYIPNIEAEIWESRKAINADRNININFL